MFEVSANLTLEILTERCSGKQVFWNWQSKLLKNTYKEIHARLQAPINRHFRKRGVFKSYLATLLKMKFSKGIFHGFGLHISLGNSQNTLF